ncbi:MAG TPA: hypothetical protein VNK52_04485 [Hyphomicrobiaceae bacterium]|nr:hypothetical protein [Hyphomicrobiaceae bacterium]
MSLGHLLALILGSALTGIEIYGCVEYLLSQQGRWSYIVAGGAFVTGCASVLPILAARAWRERRRWLAVMLGLAVFPALALVLGAAIERTGGARDAEQLARDAIARSIRLAEATVAEARAALAEREAAAARECSTGRGPICRGLEERAEAARARLAQARDALAQIGPPPVDPQARRIAAVLPLTEAQVQLYQPLILPMTISLLGILLLAYGAHPIFAARRPAPAAAANDQAPEMPPARRQRPSLRLVEPSERTGSVLAFLAHSLEAAPGSTVDVRGLYAAYKAWCAKGGLRPVSGGQFAADLSAACKSAGIEIAERDDTLFCLDMRLTA